MNDHENDADDRIGTLLRATGRRPPVPSERTERVRGSVHSAWKAEVKRRSRRRRLRFGVALAAAAAIFATIGIALRSRSVPVPEATIAARVEVATGTSGLRPGDAVSGGTTVATPLEGGVAVRMTSGHSVRLDAETRVHFATTGAIALERGAVYIDSIGANDGDTLEVITRFGTVRDVGTQFEVRLRDDTILVRVREGSVDLERADGFLRVVAGSELRVGREGRVSRGTLDRAGPGWAWVDTLTPMIEIDGLPLQVFLEWAARERGLRLELSSTDVTRTSSETRLSGSVTGMSVDEALDSVLPACGLRHRIEDQSLIVESTNDAEGTG